MEVQRSPKCGTKHRFEDQNVEYNELKTDVQIFTYKQETLYDASRSFKNQKLTDINLFLSQENVI